jgi:hypothetical protein
LADGGGTVEGRAIPNEQQLAGQMALHISCCFSASLSLLAQWFSAITFAGG